MTDDIVDITDFDVVSFLQTEMRRIFTPSTGAIMTDDSVFQPAPPTPLSIRSKPAAKVSTHDPDRFIRTAKEQVVANYNEHRDRGRSRELTTDAVYIVWFAKTLANWKAIVASATVRGLLWEVTSNGHRNEIYIDVYKKFNNTRVVIHQEEESA
jgi:Family of unknown function (DUF6275)